MLQAGVVFCVLIGVFAQAALAESNDVRLIHRIFPEAVSVEDRTLWLTDTDKAGVRRASLLPFDADYIRYRAAIGPQGVAGYALVDDVKGLHEMITYMAALNADGSIRAVEVLIYREAYGGDIRHERFRKQFVGKTIRDPLRVGSDIRNIAGATISTNAISAGMRRILALYEVGLKGKENLTTDEHGQAQTDTDMRMQARSALSLPFVRRARVLWGTTLSIEIADGDREAAERVIEACFADVEVLTSIFSRYDTASEISRMNAGDGGNWHKLSTPFYELLNISVAISRLTKGAFDPTKKAGDFQRIEWARPVAGDSPSIHIPSGVTLDFDGIAKGYAVDRMVEILKRRGIRNALINFGESSIAAMGSPKPGAAWIVPVRNAKTPRGKEVVPLTTLALRDADVSMSAAYERGPHIIDPFTGKPAVDSLQAVVVGPIRENSGAKSDALSTALFVAGSRGLAFVTESGFEGLWVGAKETRRSAGFAASEVRNAK